MTLIDRQFYEKTRNSIEIFWRDIKRGESIVSDSLELFPNETDDACSDELKMLSEIKRSSFVLMLYNMIEATVTKLVQGIIELAVRYSPDLEFKDFNKEIRRLWIKLQAQRFGDVARKDKGDLFVKLYESFCEPTDWKEYGFDNVETFKRTLDASGNLDFHQIEKIFGNFNIEIKQILTAEGRAKETTFPKEYKSALKNIKVLRNKLAHGNLAFFEGSTEKSIDDLKRYKEATFACLECLIDRTEKYCEALQKDLEEKKKNRRSSS